MKMMLEGIITSILNKHNAESWHTLPPRAKSAYRYNYSLMRMTRTRIACLLEAQRVRTGYKSERAKKRERTLAAKFMEVAKQELEKSEYKRLLTIAQQELEQDIEE